MIREYRGLIFMVVAALGIWGCNRVAPTSTREAERVKFLEAKVAKLEEDFRAAAAARDLWRQKSAEVEKESARYQKQIPPLAQERDDLRAQLNVRTTERDQMQNQYEKFRKEIRTLLGTAEAAINQPVTQPVSAVTLNRAASQS